LGFVDAESLLVRQLARIAASLVALPFIGKKDGLLPSPTPL
jgi:hypothetical protein